LDASISFGASVAIGSIPATTKSSPVIDSPFLTMEAEQLLSQVAGRDELLRQIFEELEKGSSKSLVGEALVGETYLLKQICKQGQQRLTSVEDLLYLDLRMVNPAEILILPKSDYPLTICDRSESVNSANTRSQGTKIEVRLLEEVALLA
jgi:hypothetical protein